MTDWLRPAPRPDGGIDSYEWWWARSDHLRVPRPDELGRRCSVRGCVGELYLVHTIRVGDYGKLAAHDRRSFRCREHIYVERLVEGGGVYQARPRLDRPTGRPDAPPRLPSLLT